MRENLFEIGRARDFGMFRVLIRKLRKMKFVEFGVFEREEKGEKRDLIAKFWEFGNGLSLSLCILGLFPLESVIRMLGLSLFFVFLFFSFLLLLLLLG